MRTETFGGYGISPVTKVDCHAEQMRVNELTKEEEQVVIQKWTEPPFSGKYDNFRERVRISTDAAMWRCIAQRTKSMLAVDSVVLMVCENRQIDRDTQSTFLE